MRQQVTVRGNSERVWLARFEHMKYEWVVTEGDPRDRHPLNYLRCQEVRPSKGDGPRLAETVYSGGSGGTIAKLRDVPNEFVGWDGSKVSVYVDHAPDDDD